MTHYCHFHPNSVAKWHCADCQHDYDNACLIHFNERLHQGNCPECNKALIYLPDAHKQTKAPFSISTAIKESAQKVHILLILSATIFACLLSFTSVSLWVALGGSILFQTILSLHISRRQAYFSHHHIQLRRKIHDAAQDHLSLASSLLLVAIYLISLLLPVFLFYKVNWFIGFVLAFIGVCVFPIMLLFSMHSQEEHQLSFTQILKHIKASLPQLSLISLVSFNVLWISAELSLSFSPPIIGLPVSILLFGALLTFFINLCSKLFSQALIEAQALRLSSETETTQQAKNKPNALNIQLDIALKNGDYQRAVELLQEEIKLNSASALRRQQLFLLLVALDDHEKLERYAILFLYWMLERNRVKEASQFIYLLRKNNPEFLIHDLKLMAQLAKIFVQAKKFALVVWLSEGAKTRFKPSEELATLYILGAQALLTHFKDLSQAEENLLYVLKACGEFPSAETAKALLMHIQNNLKNQRDIFQ